VVVKAKQIILVCLLIHTYLLFLDPLALNAMELEPLNAQIVLEFAVSVLLPMANPFLRNLEVDLMLFASKNYMKLKHI
jgi:hypothetical protein